MDTDDLRVFLAVIEAGGVTPAARRLGLAKSIVSRRLARLEDLVGAKLLTRTARGAMATEAGDLLRDHAARALGELEAACDALTTGPDLRGRLRLAAPLSFGAVLAPVLARFAARHPRLELYTAYTDRFVDLAGEGFDAAVRIGVLADSSLVARRIGQIEARLVASPDYLRRHPEPAEPQDLLGHEALLQGHEAWRLRDGSKEVTIKPQGRFKADSGSALAAAALEGIGIALLPAFLVDEHIASGALWSLLPAHPMPPVGIFALRPPGQRPPRKTVALIDFIARELGGPGLAAQPPVQP